MANINCCINDAVWPINEAGRQCPGPLDKICLKILMSENFTPFLQAFPHLCILKYFTGFLHPPTSLVTRKDTLASSFIRGTLLSKQALFQ